jgi:hypothetical protein
MSNSLEASEGILGNGNRGGASPARSRNESKFSAVPDVKDKDYNRRVALVSAFTTENGTRSRNENF